MIKLKNVTNYVSWDNVNNNHLSILQCVCGYKFNQNFIIGVYNPDTFYECPKCGAKLCFTMLITVYQIEDED